MPLPRTNRPRRNWSFSSLSKSSSPLQIGPHNNHAKKKKVIGSREVQMFVFVILSMAAFPLLFLHRYLQSPSSITKHRHQKNETQIQNSLNQYYKQRQQHRQDHWQHKGPPLVSASHHNENQNINQMVEDSEGRYGEQIKVLTAYLETVDTVDTPDDSPVYPLPIRPTSAARLKKVVFPSVGDNTTSSD